jgi:hypothetical protein
VSTAGGRTPLWSRSGQELFFVSAEEYVMGVRVEAGPPWRNGPPARVLRDRYYHGEAQGNTRTFDITADGRRFLMIKNADTAGSQNRMILVQHWTEELKRLVPKN